MTRGMHGIVSGEMFFYCAPHDVKEAWIEGQKTIHAMADIDYVYENLMMIADTKNKKIKCQGSRSCA